MNLADYIKLKSTPTKFAREINAHAPDLYKWMDGNTPPKWAVKIEQFTNGEVTRKELRPNDWQEFWPELLKTT